MNRRRARAFASLLAFVIAFATSILAEAHPAPSSFAFVDFTVDGARLQQDVPIEELERAVHRSIAGESPEDAVRQNEAFLRSYASEHLRAHGGSGRAWSVEVIGVEGHASADGPRARFDFVLRAPSESASSSVVLEDDIVAHEVVSHYTMVYVRSDWATGAIETEPRLVGTVHAGRFGVVVTREGSFWRGFRSVIRLGTSHIASGTDHVLFLFALVLVAPLRASMGRWSERRPPREMSLALARVVTAFTLGHSATLALGSAGIIELPARLVESAIALSIVVTAIHAVRPLFARREPVVAALFGLVHGLAFSSTLSGRNLGHAQAAYTLLGFNLGIELAQLAILAVVLPWLLLLSRTATYAAFRVGSASVALVLALGWFVERTTSLPNPAALPLAWLEAHPLPLLLLLAAGALASRTIAGRQGLVASMR